MAYVPPTTANSVPRTGSAGAWSGLANILVSDDNYATSNTLSADVKTPLIDCDGFVPPAPVSTVGLVALRVERQSNPDNVGPLAYSDYVQLTRSGVDIGAPLQQGEAVPELDTVISYTANLAALGVTTAQINAGAIGVNLGWASVFTAAAINPANWTFNLAPASTSIIPSTYPGPYGTSTTFNMVATWVGVGAAPPYVPIRLVSTSNASGPFNVPGFVALDNGQGTIVTGTIPNPPISNPGPATSAVVYSLPVSGGIATKTITITRSNTGTPPGATDFGMGSVVPTVVTPPNATVLVDSVLMEFEDGGIIDPPDEEDPTIIGSRFRYIAEGVKNL